MLEASLEDTYLRNAVRVENAKVTEAVKVARSLEEVNAELVKRLLKQPGKELTRTMVADLMVWYQTAIENVFRDAIQPALAESGQDLTTHQVEFHEKTLDDWTSD